MDFGNRAEWEAKLAKALQGFGRETVRLVLDALGNPLRYANLTPEFWARFKEELRAKIQPALEGVYLEMARGVLATSPIGVDWALVNTRARNWAKNYSFNLVQGIEANTRQNLSETIAGFFETPQTIGTTAEAIDVPALRDALGRVIMPDVRAQMIAETEITRAASEAEAGLAREIEAQTGLRTVPRWQTSQDEIVRKCPICWPRQGKLQGDGWTALPPAHPRCRCWVNYEAVRQ